MTNVSGRRERSFFLSDLPSSLVPELNRTCPALAIEEHMWPGVKERRLEGANLQGMGVGADFYLKHNLKEGAVAYF